jgi:CRISPR type III-A-associated RAMP protein Csm4
MEPPETLEGSIEPAQDSPPSPPAPVDGLLVSLRAAGPWRFGADPNDRDRLDSLYHSDTLFSAITTAMMQLGMLEEWLASTALASEPDVRFTSLFPWLRETLYVIPPRSVWPPPSGKVRTKGASFVPVPVVRSLLMGAPFDEDRWAVDGESRCLLGPGKVNPYGPFRQARRAFAAVDRLAEGHVAPHRTACLEFAPESGFWCCTAFRHEEARTRWSAPVEGAFRLLADSGFGGRRSIGWGRAVVEEVRPCSLRELLLPAAVAPNEPVDSEVPMPAPASVYWLLSLFSPGETEAVDWRQGAYSLITRGGRVESRNGWGQPKKMLRMVEEGSVLLAGAPPNGTAANVAPEGFPHPVFRYGYPVSVSLPERIVP